MAVNSKNLGFGGWAAPVKAAPASSTTALVDKLLGGASSGGGQSLYQMMAESNKKALGVAPSAPASAPAAAAPAAPGGTANTAQMNPDLQYALDKMKTRFEGDGGAGHAIDVAAGKVREWGEGARKQAAAARTARGVSGTGIDNLDERRISGDVQNRIAGVATDISLGREQQKDAMLSGIANVGATMAGVAGADRDRALAQWNAAQSNQRAQDDARLQQTLAIVNLLAKAA